MRGERTAIVFRKERQITPWRYTDRYCLHGNDASSRFACEGWQQSEFMRKKCAAGRGAKRPLDTMHKPAAGKMRARSVLELAPDPVRARGRFSSHLQKGSRSFQAGSSSRSTERTCRLCLMLSLYELSRILCVETLLPSSLLLLRDLCTWNAAQPSPWTRSRVDDEAQIDL